jgi:hypothetical protein
MSEATSAMALALPPTSGRSARSMRHPMARTSNLCSIRWFESAQRKALLQGALCRHERHRRTSPKPISWPPYDDRWRPSREGIYEPTAYSIDSAMHRKCSTPTVARSRFSASRAAASWAVTAPG